MVGERKAPGGVGFGPYVGKGVVRGAVLGGAVDRGSSMVGVGWAFHV